MAKGEKISIALTADMAAMLRQAVESGEYASSSEVVRDALRDWKVKRAFAHHHIEELRRLMDEGLASGSGPWLGVEGTIAEIKCRSAAKAAG